MDLIEDHTLSYGVKSKFVKLLRTMHLDREPLEPMQIPTLTVVWNDLPQQATKASLIKKSNLKIP